MAQGPHRFARGQFYFDHAAAVARAGGFEFAWKKEHVRGVGHNDARMNPTAAALFSELWKQQKMASE